MTNRSGNRRGQDAERMRSVARARVQAERDAASAAGLTVAEYRARRRAEKLASTPSAESPTSPQVEPDVVAARVTSPASTSPVPEPAGPVAEPATSPVTPEKPRDPVSLWQILPVLSPDPLYPEMTSAPFGFERRGGKAYVLRLSRRLEVTRWYPWSAESTSTLYLDGDGRVYQDVQPEGWEPVVVERRPPIDPRRATSDSWGRQDDGREVQESRHSAMLRGYVSAQSQANFQHRMDHGA